MFLDTKNAMLTHFDAQNVFFDTENAFSDAENALPMPITLFWTPEQVFDAENAFFDVKNALFNAKNGKPELFRPVSRKLPGLVPVTSKVPGEAGNR